MKSIKNFKNNKIENISKITGGGRISYYLGYLLGFGAARLNESGEWMDRSGFNSQGANK